MVLRKLRIWLRLDHRIVNNCRLGASTRAQEKDVDCLSQRFEALTVEDRAHISQGGNPSRKETRTTWQQALHTQHPVAFLSSQFTHIFNPIQCPVQGSPSNPFFSVCVLPATGPPIKSVQLYRDPRAQVSTYFAIFYASVTCSSVTRFTSNPDFFSVSQSWGWRSSSLRAEVCLDGDKIPDPSAPSVSENIDCMRIVVILCIVLFNLITCVYICLRS